MSGIIGGDIQRFIDMIEEDRDFDFIIASNDDSLIDSSKRIGATVIA